MNPSCEFHDIQIHEFHDLHVNNHGLEDHQQQEAVEDGQSSLRLQDLGRALSVPNYKVKVEAKKPGRLFYGTKKTRYTRKARKRCVVGCDMYIVRVKKDTQEWAMSKPCLDCWEVMHTLGIRKVYYTIADGSWVCEKVPGMEITHRGSGVLALQAYREEEQKDKKRERRS